MPAREPDKVDVYMALFRGREEVYARRFESRKKGTSGYAPVLRRDARGNLRPGDYEPLTKVVLIDQHLRGEEVLGVYPLLPDQTCWFLAFDFDGERAFAEARELVAVCGVQDLAAHLERSRSGNYHVWLFFEAPVEAWKARRVGLELLKEAGLVGEDETAEEHAFDRMFPNQDSLGGKGLGNLIALPLQGKSVLEGRTEFLDSANGFEPFENQWAFLRTVQRVSEAQLLGIDLLEGVELAAPEGPARTDAGSRLGVRLRTALRTDQENETALARLLVECAFVAHCREDAGTLPEKDWWALASNLAPFGDPGRRAFHELSKDYPGYDPAETDVKFDRQLEDPKPHTCSFLREKVWDCGRDCGVRSPCALPFRRAQDAAVPADLEAAIEAIPERAAGNALEAGLAPVLRGLALLLDEGERTRLLGRLAERTGLGRAGLAVRVAELPEHEGERGAEGLPAIVVNNRQVREVIADAWVALHAANDPPVLFRRGGEIVRRDRDEHGLRVRSVDEAAAFGRLARVADWIRVRTDDPPLETSPPKDVARDLLAYPDDLLPLLETVLTTPVFGRTGRLLAEPGYHAQDRLWLEPPAELAGLEVPERPTNAEVAEARRLLLDELLVDFPFVDASDRAHMVAALVLPFVRRLVDGVTPLHLLEAPSAGSGKGLLSGFVATVATGVASVAKTLPFHEDEARKMITAELAEGRPIVLLDNAKERKVLDCAALCAVVTAELWSDRILGRTQMTTLPNRAVWLVTANNPDLSMEIARRCVRIRIDAKIDRPWLREGFRHESIAAWAKENRRALVHAVLVLVKAWLSAGRPRHGVRLGSFESWSETVGGILDVAGIGGFLGNLAALYEAADAEGRTWREFTAAWSDRFGSDGVKAADLLALCDELELMPLVLGDGSERSKQVRLGRALHRARDRVFGNLRITAEQDLKTKSKRYAVVPVEEPAGGISGGEIPPQKPRGCNDL